MSEPRLVERLAENPFHVLGLKPDCSRQDLEREGQKLLAMLTLALAEAQTYQTPAGPRARTPELVRAAMAELRDPKKRLVHELLASLPAEAVVEVPKADPSERWVSAPLAFGYGPSRSRG